MHGFRYLSAGPPLASVLWAAVLLTTSATSVYALYYNTEEFLMVNHALIMLATELLQQKPITYISDTTAPLAEVRFPSVTICNVNQVNS